MSRCVAWGQDSPSVIVHGIALNAFAAAAFTKNTVSGDKSGTSTQLPAGAKDSSLQATRLSALSAQTKTRARTRSVHMTLTIYLHIYTVRCLDVNQRHKTRIIGLLLGHPREFKVIFIGIKLGRNGAKPRLQPRHKLRTINSGLNQD